MRDDPVRDDPVRDDPVRDDPVRDDPVRDDPVRDDPVRDDPVRDDPVAALSAFKDSHQGEHAGKDFDTIGWPNSVDWISIGGNADERRRSRQASLFFIDLNPKEDGKESLDEDLADEGLEA